MYLSNLPEVNYPYYDNEEKLKFKISKNITSRVKISNFVKKYRSNFSDYVIKDGERPDILSNRLYDTPNLNWIIFLVNDIINPYFSWPLSSKELESYIDEKYNYSSFFVPQIWDNRTSYLVCEKKLSELSKEEILNSTFFESRNILKTSTTSIGVDTPIKVVIRNSVFETKINEISSLFFEIKLDRKNWNINTASDTDRFIVYEIDYYGNPLCIRVPVSRIVDRGRNAVNYFIANGEKQDPSQEFLTLSYEESPYKFFLAPISENKLDYSSFMNKQSRNTFADLYATKGRDGKYLDSSFYVTNEQYELDKNESNRNILLPRPDVVRETIQQINSIF